MGNKFKDIDIKNFGYVTIKHSKYIKTNSVNSLYLIISKVNGYFEETNRRKYLMLVPTNEIREIIRRTVE